LTTAAVESTSEQFTTYNPPGKSRKVIGGIGTFRLPQDVAGYRLAAITGTLNASAAVPILLSDDDWERNRLKEGTNLRVYARWRSMALGWSEQFPVMAGIPRGYLVPSGRNAIHVWKHDAPVQIHPFTVMRYDAGPAERYDFVYATADTGDPDHRDKLAWFFDGYRTENGRYGEYLLPGDHVCPMWDALYGRLADFVSPGDNPLRLLEERVRDSMIGGEIDALIERLAGLQVDDMKRYSVDIGIPHSTWKTTGTAAQCANRFVVKAVEMGRVSALIERAVIELLAPAP